MVLSAVAVNFFFQPGHVYSSGATGLAQIISALSNHWFGFHIPISLTFYAINFPLMVWLGIRLAISLRSLPLLRFP